MGEYSLPAEYFERLNIHMKCVICKLPSGISLHPFLHKCFVFIYTWNSWKKIQKKSFLFNVQTYTYSEICVSTWAYNSKCETKERNNKQQQFTILFWNSNIPHRQYNIKRCKINWMNTVDEILKCVLKEYIKEIENENTINN